MNPETKKYGRDTESKPVDNDIEPDEDFEIDIDFDKNLSHGTYNDIKTNPKFDIKPPIERKAGLRRSTFAGILLIIVFFLNLLLPINFILAIQEIETSSGLTSLKGKVLDADGTPVDNVTVEILNSNYTTSTKADGKYKFESVPVGEAEIHFFKPGYQKIIVKKTLFSKSFLSQGGLNDNVINIPGELSSGLFVGAIEGPINSSKFFIKEFNKTLSGIITNRTGFKLQNANLKLMGLNKSANTDDHGRFYFYDVPPGIINIQITILGNKNITGFRFLFAKNGSIGTFDYNFTFLENLNKQIDLVTGRTGVISGEVNIAQNNTISKLKVKLFTVQPSNTSDNNKILYSEKFLDRTGKFRFENIPLGIYNLEINGIGYSILEIKNISVENNSNTELLDLDLEKLEDSLIVEEDILNEYTIICIIILFLLSIVTLIGAVCAIRHKRYSLAFTGALCGALPGILALGQINICGAGLISVVALFLLVFSRNDFEFKKRNARKST